MNKNENIINTPDFVVYADKYDHWHSTLKANYKTIRDKSFTRYITSGSKEKCDKKAEAHNEKMGLNISLKWTPHVVYKDEMGIFYTKPEMIIDWGTPVYRGSQKECRAFIEGKINDQTDYWRVILDEEGEFETVSNNKGGDVELYAGKAQDCSDFVSRLSNIEAMFKTIYNHTFKPLRNQGVDKLSIGQLKLDDLLKISKCLTGIEVFPRDLVNCPLIKLLMKHNFLNTDFSMAKSGTCVYKYLE